MSVLKKSFQYGQHSISIETGEIARQASASVIVSMGDTVVLVTAVAASEVPAWRATNTKPVRASRSE